ncbi:MAG: glycosyltransferase family 39 protein [Acidobacteriota bacterium]|jgi:hypothetical protein
MPQTTTTNPIATTPADRPPVLPILLALVALKLALHLYVNLFAGYEIFRDELYYLACASHPALGYVDQPPLSIWLLAGVRSVLGDSLFAIRLLPALAGAALVFVTGLLARELSPPGGGRLAVTLAAGCSLVSGFALAVSSFYSMNVFDLLLVAVACLLLVRLIDTEDPRLWLALGAVLGLGLLNKVGVLWVGLGVFVGTLATRERRWLRTPWPWAAGAIAAALFLPYLIWNATHDWAHLEFIGRAVTGKYSGLDAWSFLSGQVLMQNPVSLPVWLAGLGWLLFAPGGRRYRLLGIVWVTACLVLLANGHSKAEYLSNVYAPLFAAGGVAWEQALARSGAGWAPALARGALVALVLSGLLLAPLATPILPVETYVEYADALGFAPSTPEGHELAELPQFYADMFGWRAKAEAVAAVYHALPEEDRARAAIFADNYGRSGAVDYWADELGLPGAIGNHNSYWLWGPGDATGEVVIVLGGDRDDLERRFRTVTLAGRADCDWCIPYERDLPIFVCREALLPMDELWPLTRHFS